jgi:1-pyrroline-5-carboxylate dehydrogenase
LSFPFHRRQYTSSTTIVNNNNNNNNNNNSMSLPSWATVDPMMMGSTSHAGDETPYHVMNYCHGQWMKTTSGTTATATTTTTTVPIIHPVDRDAPPIFIDSLRLIPKSGLHNPYKNPHRYVQYGEISRLVGGVGVVGY